VIRDLEVRCSFDTFLLWRWLWIVETRQRKCEYCVKLLIISSELLSDSTKGDVCRKNREICYIHWNNHCVGLSNEVLMIHYVGAV